MVASRRCRRGSVDEDNQVLADDDGSQFSRRDSEEAADVITVRPRARVFRERGNWERRIRSGMSLRKAEDRGEVV